MYSHKAGWTLGFVLQSLLYEHLATDMSLLPSLIVQIRQHKEYFQGWLDAVSNFGTFWLVSAALGLLASPWCLLFTFCLPPQERQEGSSMCQALTWEPDLRKTCPICAVQCNRKTSVHNVTRDKVICESIYLRCIQFLILEGTQARESCLHTVLSSLQSTH